MVLEIKHLRYHTCAHNNLLLNNNVSQIQTKDFRFKIEEFAYSLHKVLGVLTAVHPSKSRLKKMKTSGYNSENMVIIYKYNTITIRIQNNFTKLSSRGFSALKLMNFFIQFIKRYSMVRLIFRFSSLFSSSFTF